MKIRRFGERLVSRQEIDLPFQAGPVKLVPYALGELGHWGQDIGDPTNNIEGSSIDRAYGQVGVRDRACHCGLQIIQLRVVFGTFTD